MGKSMEVIEDESSEQHSQGCLVRLGHTEVGSLSSYVETSSRTQALLVLVTMTSTASSMMLGR